MAADNTLGLLFRISADPKQAVEGIEALEAHVQQLEAQVGKSGEAFTQWQQADKALWEARRQAAHNARIAQTQFTEAVTASSAAAAEGSQTAAAAAGVTAREVAQAQEASAAAELESLGFVKDAWMKNAAAARAYGESVAASGESANAAYAAVAERLNQIAGEEEAATAGGADLAAVSDTIGVRMGTAAGEASNMGGNIRESITGLRSFRMLMYSSLGLISFGFYIAEWQKVVDIIGQGTLALGGFSIAEQNLLAQQTKFNQQLISSNASALEAEISRLNKESDRLRKEISETEKLGGAPVRSLDAMASGMYSAYDAAAQKLAQLHQALRENDDATQKANLELAEYRRSHKGATEAVASHTDALAALVAAERDEISQLQIGDSARQRVIASYDAEIRRINQTADALKRKKEFTAAEAKEAEDARVMAAQIRDQKLKQIDDAEIKREEEKHTKIVAATGKAAEAEVDKAVASARRKAEVEKRKNEEFNRGMAGALGHGASQLPGALLASPGGLSQAALEAAGHIDSETRAVWNLQAALLGLGPVIDEIAQKHQNVIQFEDKFADAMGKNIAMAIVYGNSIGAAVEKALKASVASIAADAMVRALFSTGFGLLMLAEHDYTAAAQAFEAAAVFGAVGGAAAAVAHVIPGGAGAARGGARAGGAGVASRSGSAAGNGATGSPLAPGAGGPHYPGGQLTVAVMGDEEAGNWLATTLNQAVETQGVRLVSSHTKTSAPVGQ